MRLLLLAGLVLAGCASGPPAPVVDLTIADTNPPAAAAESGVAKQVAGVYTVKSGDTLYSIAFTRGLDYRDLAQWNRISPPYTIYKGELLQLHAPVVQGGSGPPPGQAVTRAAPDNAQAARVVPIAAAPAARNPAAPKPAPGNRHLPPPGALAAAPLAPGKSSTGATKPANAAPKPVPEQHVAQLKAGGVVWRWPSDGKVVSTFVDGNQTRQGIDIAGKAGDPVRAAADGEVVYSGNGLIGYGELIIIKHNASYLSAYGHNRKRLVSEGDHVHAGQRIAELGATASARDELHFEIRKNGKPVNPLDYLPAR